MSRIDGPYKARNYKEPHWIEGPGISPAFLNGWATMTGDEIAQGVAAALNIAYDQGKEDLKERLRNLIGIEEPDDLK